MMEYIRKSKLIARKSAAEPASMDSIELMVGYILLIGVLLSVGLIISGTVWNLILNHSLSTSFTISNVNYFDFFRSSLSQLFHGAIQPRLLISLGIATLMLTPYLRVLASFIYFAFFARNMKYTLFTLFVFTVLTYSLFLR